MWKYNKPKHFVFLKNHPQKTDIKIKTRKKEKNMVMKNKNSSINLWVSPKFYYI